MSKASAAAAVEPTVAPAPGRFELVPVARLVESPLNHRKRTWGDMEDMIASVRSKGVLQPILARPVTGIGENMLEIVFGHRRVRAAREAGLEAVPAVIRELSDFEVVEAQVIENLQRADVHPLEEAEGYEQLLASKEHAYTVDDIAAKVGKSKAYVYGRMKLLALCPAARKAFYDGKLNASVALLLARIPVPELQEKAIAAVLNGGEWDHETGERGVMSFRDAQAFVIEEYTLRLAEAPFKKDDAELLPAAGPCTTCPKRTGAQPELFADVKSADVCTDPTCFAEKKKAEFARIRTTAKEKGLRLLTEKESREVFDQYQVNAGAVRWASPFVKLSDRCEDDPKRRTWKQLLADKAPEKVLGRDPRGKVHELVEKAAAAKALKDAGHDFKVELPKKQDASSVMSKADREEADRRQVEKQRIKNEVSDRLGAALAQAMTSREPDEDLWRIIAESLLETANGDVARRRLKKDAWVSPAEAVKILKGLRGAELRGLALELVFEQALYDDGYGNHDAELLGRALKWAGVDQKTVEKQVRDELAATKPANEKKAPAKKKGARRG
jgi:ParB family transcriptional regulator, chromosome partitioning protein